MEGVSAAGLQTLLQYAYTGQVGISQSNLQNVLEAAAHLQFHEVSPNDKYSVPSGALDIKVISIFNLFILFH